ncbi:hypothetical protein L596_030201 [Steinernema carpocapsae]|uniref:Uncharacterized protein n=1 Tax=Steinernema carpocapsae TaxID=34508 RepID=A0A4U5LS06_STECR|nr:hypothetical protein L596_030201 [Steinernema carpocapsae]
MVQDASPSVLFPLFENGSLEPTISAAKRLRRKNLIENGQLACLINLIFYRFFSFQQRNQGTENQPKDTNPCNEARVSTKSPTSAASSTLATLRKIQPIVIKPLKNAFTGKTTQREPDASTKVGDMIVYNVEKSVVVGGGEAEKRTQSLDRKTMATKRPSKSPSPAKSAVAGVAEEERSYQTLIMKKKTDECFADAEFKAKDEEK